MSEPVEAALLAPDALIRETLLALLEVIRSGAASLDRERERANEEREPLLRRYRLGLVDGVDETLKALARAVPAELTELCRGCVGGWGFADNAHTRDAHCQYGQPKASSAAADQSNT